MPYYLGNCAGTVAATAAKWDYDKTKSPHDDKYKFTGPDGGRYIDHAEFAYDCISTSALILAKGRKSLGNFVDVSRGDGFCISERARRVFEALEPGAHDFRPLPIRTADGTPWPEPYWFYYYTRVPGIAAIDLQASSRWIRIDDRFSSGPRLNGVVSTALDEPEVFLDRAATAGRHFFREGRTSLNWFFISDECHAALKQAKAMAGISLGFVGLSGA
jgi:hypothetical protein